TGGLRGKPLRHVLGIEASAFLSNHARKSPLRSLSLLAAPLIAIVLLTAPPAQAHHGFDAEFVAASPITLKGPISAVEWVNPHVWIHMTVAEPGKAPQDWMIEAYTPNRLLRWGVDKQSLAVGSEITVRAYLARDQRCLDSPMTHRPTCKAGGR